MKDVIRLEIIIEKAERELVLNILSKEGIDGWTILPVISGHGGRGDRGIEGLPGSFENDLILVIVNKNQFENLKEVLRPILKRWGGVALASEAQWLLHD